MTRNRIVKIYGNSYAIKLEPADVKDFKIKEGMLVDIEPTLLTLHSNPIDENNENKNKRD